MMIALSWLTVSVSFVSAFQEEMAKQQQLEHNQSQDASSDEDSNPFGNNTEEKTASSNTSFSEEYLHDHPVAHFISAEIFTLHALHNDETYLAFHGELLVPPPNCI